MTSASRPAKAATVLGAVAVLALVAIPAALAAFAGPTDNSGDIVTAAPDFTPPAITATVLSKSQGGTAGYVKRGGTYFLYANVSADTGNPASGLSTVRANVAEFTTGQTEVTMTAGGPYTVGGASYNYRSAELTVTATTEGSKTYTVTAKDVAGNARTVSGTATIENTVPTATDIQTSNVSGGTVGFAETGDTITYTFSKAIEPQSILAGWNGSATNVVVRMIDNGLLSTSNDELMINNAANTAALPLGSVNMGRVDYVGGLLGGSIYFGATGTASTMTMSGNAITVKLGTYSFEQILVGRATAGGVGTMVWTPVATPYDRADNVVSTTPVSETGAADKDF